MSFEDRLAAWGAVEAAAAGPAPVVPLRRRRLWQPLVAAAAVLVLIVVVALVAGGGSPRGAHPVTSPVPAPDVPWADIPYGPTVYDQVSPTPSVTAPACTADELSLRFGNSNGFTGAEIGQYVAVSTTTPCTLSGRVTAISALVSGRRQDLPLVASTGPADVVGTPGVIRPGQPGGLAIYYNLSCEGEDPPPPSVHHTDFRFTFLGHTFDVGPGPLDHGDLSFCSTTIGVGSAAAPTPVVHYLHDPLSDLVASLAVPASAPSDGTLSYVVTLTNPTAHSIALTPCPSYTEFTSFSKERFQLNCAAAHPVPAGGQETFGMQLSLSGTEIAGTAHLGWLLDVVTDSGASRPVQATFTVTGGPDAFAGHAACTPSDTEAPCGPSTEIGHEYPYLLTTACHALFAFGQWWLEPSGVGDLQSPRDPGFVTLMKPGVSLQYRAAEGYRSFWSAGDKPAAGCG